MALNRFSYLDPADDLFATATLTPDSEDPDFPWSNAQSDDPEEFIGKTANGETTLDLLIDLGSAQPFNLAGFINTNLTTNAAIDVEAGNTTATSAFTMSLLNDAAQDNYIKAAATQTYRYVRILIDDSGNTDGYISIGRIVLGMLSAVPIQYRWGERRTRRTSTRQAETELGVDQVQKLFKRRFFEMTIDGLTAAEGDTLMDFLDSLDGAAKPVLIIPDPSSSACFYCRLASDPEEIRAPYTTVGLSWKQESRGVRIAA